MSEELSANTDPRQNPILLFRDRAQYAPSSMANLANSDGPGVAVIFLWCPVPCSYPMLPIKSVNLPLRPQAPAPPIIT